MRQWGKRSTVAQTGRSEVLHEFGARVRTRRLELGLSQQELADRTGLHHALIGHVEHGRRNLRLDNLGRLARGLDLDLGELLDGLATTNDEWAT